MSNSPLVNVTRLSPNCGNKVNGVYVKNRNMKIDRLTPHHMAGVMSVESALYWFAVGTKTASANYVIGNDGRIGLCVEEHVRPWTSSTRYNDNRAITFEVSNSAGEAAGWPVSDKAFESLVKLCIDICKRYGKKRLIWISDKNKALAYEPKDDELQLTQHNWFAPTNCPGPYLGGKFQELADRVTAALNQKEEKKQEEEEMTYDKFVEYLTRYNAELAKKAPSGWATQNAKNAILSGLFNDGDGDGLLDNPQSPVSREQLAAVLDRAGIFAAQDRFIARFKQLPDWAKAPIRELLDKEHINGGTKKADDPDDINMYLSDIKVIAVIKRMLDEERQGE